ncbi:Flavin prenyltransferase UbiX [hydrothermal vent metagenome]|uniref:flavin prenyltransferase n=1 Tax=hydrothermal vent metagenome TaxID=652676 RepID=A0A3B0YQ97_9ZZZZ
MTKKFDKTIALALTGASGAQYGLRLLEILIQNKVAVYLMISKPGQIVINMETDLKLSGKNNDMQQTLAALYHAEPGQLTLFDKDQWTAPVASGTGVADAMVICPCTMGTLAAVANGLSNNLIERAADVTIKEKRPLILVPREAPFSIIHLQNMLQLAQAGATIMPPNPGFYYKPTTINELIDFVVARILDHIDIPHCLLPRWGEE